MKTRLDHLRNIVDLDRRRMYERTIFFEWLMLALVVAGVWLHGYSLTAIFGKRWRSARQMLTD